MKKIVIFGGSGFIGMHFAKFLIENKIASDIVLADHKEPGKDSIINTFIEAGQVSFVHHDVRNPVAFSYEEGSVDLICNFAAVHREPGHESDEYYNTNIPGAQYVCEWAEKVKCNKIIFTSSIAPYGPTEEPKSEYSIPTPITAYGGSKLVAEKMHTAWQAKDLDNRRLVIIRPGVVFGQGEGGNVSRLVKALKKGYFFYMGNENTRKAGVYVKELCNSLAWVLEQQNSGVTLYNMSMNPSPTMEEYVETINEVSGISRKPLKVPFSVLYPISYVVDFFAKIAGVNQPISPVRLRKLVKSNNIVPKRLEELGYTPKYSLKTAMQDWKNDSPSEW